MLASLKSRPATKADEPAIAILHGRVFGPGRFARTAYRVREGRPGVSRLCRVVDVNGRIAASIHLTDIVVGGVPGAALLGPIGVDPDFQSQGFGKELMTEAIEGARAGGVRVILLVGDEPYYGRFGFKPCPRGQITLPGPVNMQRLLALEIQPGALAQFVGVVAAA
jgi:predicted N-acetyltransferase YhbS